MSVYVNTKFHYCIIAIKLGPLHLLPLVSVVNALFTEVAVIIQSFPINSEVTSSVQFAPGSSDVLLTLGIDPSSVIV
jgi:hypothetical protein